MTTSANLSLTLCCPTVSCADLSLNDFFLFSRFFLFRRELFRHFFFFVICINYISACHHATNIEEGKSVFHFNLLNKYLSITILNQTWKQKHYERKRFFFRRDRKKCKLDKINQDFSSITKMSVKLSANWFFFCRNIN